MNYKKHTNLTLIDCTIEDIEKKAPWFLEAETEDAKIKFQLETLVFVDGIWKGGIWEDGTWQNGIWEEGLWSDGVWEKGLWEDGNWEGGSWVSGVWKKGKITQSSNKPPQ